MILLTTFSGDSRAQRLLRQADYQEMELLDSQSKHSNNVLAEARFRIENIIKITSLKVNAKIIKIYIGLPKFSANIDKHDKSPFVSSSQKIFSYKNLAECTIIIISFEFHSAIDAKRCIDILKKNYIQTNSSI